jgi:hypothetical protein
VTASRAPGRSPTTALLLGLIITLATVVAYSWYISGQISGLRRLQTELTDRNRRDSLQLLRIQNDLNQLGLAMRDMLDDDGPYPLTAWSTQFDRIRTDLDDALRRQGEVALAQQTPEQRQYLASQLDQFWDAADRIFELTRAGHEDEARAQIRLSLQERQAALSTAVARLLVQNNASEEQTAQQVQDIYGRVQQQVYWFLAATLAAIVATSLYLIHSNRRLFAQLASLSDERRELAQMLIATRESTLREISRELHDEFGQILTAIGSMLTRAGKQAPKARSFAATFGKFAKWRRRRSTTSADCHRRCTRRSSRSWDSKARLTGISRRWRNSSASRCRTSVRHRRTRGRDDRDSRLSGAPRSAQQRRQAFRQRPRHGAVAHRAGHT